jgi:hypothetical protein
MLPAPAGLPSRHGTADSGASPSSNTGRAPPGAHTRSQPAVCPALVVSTNADEDLPTRSDKTVETVQQDDGCPVPIRLPDIDTLSGTEFDPNAGTDVLKSAILGRHRRVARRTSDR